MNSVVLHDVRYVHRHHKKRCAAHYGNKIAVSIQLNARFDHKMNWKNGNIKQNNIAVNHLLLKIVPCENKFTVSLDLLTAFGPIPPNRNKSVQ